MRKRRVSKRLAANPDYQRLLRYYAREESLDVQEKEAYERRDWSEVNVARGLLHTVRAQICELEKMLGLSTKA